MAFRRPLHCAYNKARMAAMCVGACCCRIDACTRTCTCGGSWGASDKGLAGMAAVVRSTASWHGTFHMATLPLSVISTTQRPKLSCLHINKQHLSVIIRGQFHINRANLLGHTAIKHTAEPETNRELGLDTARHGVCGWGLKRPGA